MLYVKEIELKFRKRPVIGMEGVGIFRPEDVCDLIQDIRDSVIEKMLALGKTMRKSLMIAQGSYNTKGFRRRAPLCNNPVK